MVQTGSVNQEDVGAIMAGLAAYVINLPVTVDVQNMGSVKMEPAFVHKDGMADTAPCVSIYFFIPDRFGIHSICNIFNRKFCVHFLLCFLPLDKS